MALAAESAMPGTAYPKPVRRCSRSIAISASSSTIRIRFCAVSTFTFQLTVCQLRECGQRRIFAEFFLTKLYRFFGVAGHYYWQVENTIARDRLPWLKIVWQERRSESIAFLCLLGLLTATAAGSYYSILVAG